MEQSKFQFEGAAAAGQEIRQGREGREGGRGGETLTPAASRANMPYKGQVGQSMFQLEAAAESRPKAVVARLMRWKQEETKAYSCT